MTVREFRRLRAGNLVQEALSKSTWVVVERRRWERPCLILERARPSAAELPTHWVIAERYAEAFRRLA